MRIFVAAIAIFLSGVTLALPWVKIATNKGDIWVELNEEKAPRTVSNFMRYVREGFYDGTIFHRVIPGFMIQGGGYTETMQEKPTYGPIASEAYNQLKNKRGTLAMARTQDPHSATAQFFINLVDNDYLNANGVDAYGYTVFGVVRKGMDVVDAISKVPTGAAGEFLADVPEHPVIIRAITAIDVSEKPQEGDGSRGESTSVRAKQSKEHATSRAIVGD